MELKPQNLSEPRALPEQFLDSHYCQFHVLEMLGIDEPTFWGMYVTGRIPRGYSLMALTGVPLIVWPHRILNEWNETGRPVEPGALELENEILHSLMDAYEADGIVWPHPIKPEELN